MLQTIRSYLLQGNSSRLFWFLSIVGIIITFLLIRYKIRPTSEPLILHYNVVVGVDMLGSGRTLYQFPTVAASLVVINFVIARLVPSPSHFLSFLASFISFFVVVVLLAATLFIIGIN